MLAHHFREAGCIIAAEDCRHAVTAAAAAAATAAAATAAAATATPVRGTEKLTLRRNVGTDCVEATTSQFLRGANSNAKFYSPLALLLTLA